MADTFNNTVQRGQQRAGDPHPHHHDDQQHNQQRAAQHPQRLVIRPLVFFNRLLIEGIVLLQIFAILLLKAILVTLGRLIEELVNFARAQQANQVRQRIVVNTVVALDLHRRHVALTRIARLRFILSPCRFGLLQRAAGNLRQIRDGRTATDIVLIHHIANTRAVQRVAGLQQRYPAFIERGLLLADGLQDGEVLFVMLEGVEEQTARGEL